MSDDLKIISVAIVEDDEEIRNLLEILINNSSGFSCTLSFSSFEEALESIKNQPPDVVLMDIELPGISGIDGVKYLKTDLEKTEFIMLTIRDDDDTVFQSLTAGASGYLLKDTPPNLLLNGIREVYDGGSPMTASIARKVTRYFRPIKVSPLSDRELEILELICKGKNYTHIADQLYISGHTVRAHIKNIYQKLQVHSRAEVVNKAIREKLI